MYLLNFKSTLNIIKAFVMVVCCYRPSEILKFSKLVINDTETKLYLINITKPFR